MVNESRLRAPGPRTADAVCVICADPSDWRQLQAAPPRSHKPIQASPEYRACQWYHVTDAANPQLRVQAKWGVYHSI